MPIQATSRPVAPLAAKQPVAPAGTFPHPRRGPSDAPILVLCDTPSPEAMRTGTPMEMKLHTWFARRALEAGFVEADFQFVCVTPPVPETSMASASRKWKFCEEYQERVREIVEEINPRVVVTLGEIATRFMTGKPVKITKARGVVRETYNGRHMFPMLSPKLCVKQPDNTPIFDADLGTLHRLKAGDFDPAALFVTDVDYQWCTDLSDWVENRPRALAVDTETTGLDFRDPDFRVLTVQLSDGPGRARVCPLPAYADRWREWFVEQGIDVSPDQLDRLKEQLTTLLEDRSIRKMGQNVKFDDGALWYAEGINTQWNDDTELMVRNVNENMMTYNLDDCVRVYVPEMSGYADGFNATVDKNHMLDVHPEKMLPYAGGDPDAVYRLGRAVWPMLAKEKGQLFLYQQVQMRGLMSFSKRVERFGQTINRDALIEYRNEVSSWVDTEERELFALVPAAVRLKYTTGKAGDDLRKQAEKDQRSIPDILFNRDQFLIDTLFGQEGFKLKPKVYTKSTAKLCPPHQELDERVPSVSTKDHMPYFKDKPGTETKSGQFVARLIELVKAKKLLTTYIGKTDETGFGQYIKEPANDNDDIKIFPSYNFRTNTFRTNSVEPNGQNFPKRGRWAKGFLKLITASSGKVLVAADLSQIELRLAAWSANEREMLRIYNSGGDIHEATAAAVMRLSIEEFRALASAERKLQRFRAKAVNFGFIYGAQWRTFQTYAKTNYEVDYNDNEAQETRDLFFQKYDLLPWHASVEAFVKEHGYVRTLHGGIRHLHSVWSEDWKVSSEAVRQAINAPIQRMGSDLGVIAIARLAAQCDPRLMRPVGFVHDQVICEVDPGYVHQAMGWLCWVMENPPLEEWFGIRPPLPIVAEPDFGQNLADAVEVPRERVDIVKPEWWNDQEDRAYENFMSGHVPEWTFSTDHIQPRQRSRLILPR